MIRTRWAFLAASLALAAGLLGCNNKPAENGAAGGAADGSKLSGSVQVDGSSTVFPITEAVAEEYRKVQPDVRVPVAKSGTGGGFKKLSRGEIDIVDASRPIKEEEAKSARENSINFIELPVAYDAISVVVNPQNTWANDITVAELKKIWEPAAQGKVTRWNQVRAGWPDREIKLYGPGPDSGTFDYFTEAIVGEEGKSRGDYTSSEDDNVLVQGVANDPDALGYFGIAYYLENQSKLKALGIEDEKAENGTGPQAPTKENVLSGTYQPLARPLFIYVRQEAAQRPEVRGFIDFYLDQAPELAEEVGYIPLQPEVYQLVKERFAKGTTGSLFVGGSQVGVKLAELLKQPGS